MSCPWSYTTDPHCTTHAFIQHFLNTNCASGFTTPPRGPPKTTHTQIGLIDFINTNFCLHIKFTETVEEFHVKEEKFMAVIPTKSSQFPFLVSHEKVIPVIYFVSKTSVHI